MPARTALAYIPPSELLAANPCLACFSEKELLALIVVSLSQASQDYADDIPALLTDSKCFMCMSRKQMLQAVAAIILNQALNGETAAQLRARIRCLQCASDKQLQAALVYIMGNSFQIEI